MKFRLIIAATIFALLGFYTQQGFAADCAKQKGCMPVSGMSHTGDQNCGCLPHDADLTNQSCPPAALFQRYQQSFLSSASHQPGQYDVFLASYRLDHAPISDHWELSCGGNSDQALLSYPIYLQTLALLY